MQTARQRKAEERRLKREEWIRRIMSRTPYMIHSAMYVNCCVELRKLSDDCLMVCALATSGAEVHKAHS